MSEHSVACSGGLNVYRVERVSPLQQLLKSVLLEGHLMSASSVQGRSAPVWVAILSIAAIVLIGYAFMLGNFFTGTDSLTLIETSRIESIGDIGRILAEPLMGSSKFLEVAKFYRPVSSFSYSIDNVIWGLDPFGFQLSNVLMHMLTSILVFVLMRELSGRNTLFSWLSAALFAAHPVLIESVPAIDRRHDILATFFLLASLIAFLMGRSNTTRPRFLLGLSVLSYLIALGAKETAIVLPGLIFCYALVFETGDVRNRFSASVRAFLPFAVSTLLYLVWRVYVLGGLGGYHDPHPATLWELLCYMANVVQAYGRDLVYPVDFLNLLGDDGPYNLTPCVILYAAAYSLAYVRCLKTWRTGDGKLVLFLVVWTLAPLAVFLGTMTFAHRSMYLPAAPFCALAVLPVVDGIERLSTWVASRRRHRKRADGMLAGIRASVHASTGIVVLGLALPVSLIAFSPLFQQYEHWADSARISRLFLERLSEGTATLSGSNAIHIYNLPDRILSHLERVPHAREVTYLQHYSIKSWLNMKHPGNRMRVVIHTRSCPQTFSGDLDVSIRFVGEAQVWALVQLDRQSFDFAPLYVRQGNR